MAFKDDWKDKQNNIDIVDAKDINDIANELIRVGNKTDEIQETVESVGDLADTANSTAEMAHAQASSASVMAQNALDSAENALNLATASKTTAQSAISAANEALESANAAHVRIDELDEKIDKILPEFFVTYGVSIDLSNSNPETAVTYTDDAVGMIAGSDVWYKMSIFKDILPCLFKDGKVVGYLNRDNFAQLEDGTAADITSGEAGDVMIEIPKIGFKIAKSGTTLTVQVTNEPEKEGFSYMAHTRKTEGDREKLYVGAYLGGVINSRLCSLSGYMPHIGALQLLRSLAKQSGSSYDILSFYPLMLIQCLYLIKYKNRNSQEALGQGYVGGSACIETGATAERGMDYGSDSDTEQIKLLGMEDFWGNGYQWIEGIFAKHDLATGNHAYVATENFNDAAEGYKDLGALTITLNHAALREPQGSNELGFIVAKGTGSTSTYFTDGAGFGDTSAPQKLFAGWFGGGFNDEAYAGIFRFDANMPPDDNTILCARLMYL